MQMPETEFKMHDDPFPCEALELAVTSMRNGEDATITVHDATFAFGAAGLPGVVPPNEAVSYRVTLHNFKDGPANYELDGAAKVERAESLKERGNKWFKVNALGRARRMYDKAETIASQSVGCSTEQSAALADVQRSVALNLAAVALKKGNAQEAITSCNKARAWNLFGVECADRHTLRDVMVMVGPIQRGVFF
jgi:hypothetical protein